MSMLRLTSSRGTGLLSVSGSVLFIALIAQLVSITFVSRAQAQNLNNAPMIFDVRRSLPLQPEEPSYHDFYINAGPEAGFRKSQYVTVVRLVPVHDPVQNKQQATLTVNVAQLQVIHVERNITVARLKYEYTDEERPTLEYESVMIGDHIDPASLTMEAPAVKKPAKKAANGKSAAAATREVEVVVLNQVAPVNAPVANSATTAATSVNATVEAPSVAAAPIAATATGIQTQAKADAPVALPLGNIDSKNGSPETPAAGMVRVPIPGSGTKNL